MRLRAVAQHKFFAGCMSRGHYFGITIGGYAVTIIATVFVFTSHLNATRAIQATTYKWLFAFLIVESVALHLLFYWCMVRRLHDAGNTGKVATVWLAGIVFLSILGTAYSEVAPIMGVYFFGSFWLWLGIGLLRLVRRKE